MTSAPAKAGIRQGSPVPMPVGTAGSQRRAPAGDPELVTILQTYNEVTARLKRSHDTLLAEVGRLRGELHEKNKQLEQRERLAALGEMAAGVAHEIRNPLGGIGLYASLLERDLADRPKERDIARRVSAGVQSLEAIVRDILAFARGAEPALERTGLSGVVVAAVAHVEARIATMGVELELDERLEGVEVFCDPGQIERAIVNLLLNAIDAAGERGRGRAAGPARGRSQPGRTGGRVWIRLMGDDAPGAAGDKRAVPAGTAGDGRPVPAPQPGPARSAFGERRTPAANSVSIAIEDNGPGIPAEMVGRIFNPFFTTKHHGTGLGLAIVHAIAEAHGGNVAAGCREGGGTSFVLTLPADPGSQGRQKRSRAGARLTYEGGDHAHVGRVLRQRIGARQPGRREAPAGQA